MKIDLSVLRAVEREQRVAFDDLVRIAEQAVVMAYLRHTGLEDADLVKAKLNRKTGEIDLRVKHDGDFIPYKSDAFSRMAATAAKRVITSKMRTLSDDSTFARYKTKIGTVLSGVISQSTSQNFRMVSLDRRTEAILRPEEQIPGEEYPHGKMVKVYVTDVTLGPRGSNVYVSRTHPGLINGLFLQEVPEIASGTVEIVAVSREAGHRTKVSVRSNSKSTSAVGACVGEYGCRVRAVTSEICNEKIDIISYSDDLGQYVANAISPATAADVFVLDSRQKVVRLYVSKEEYSLAIGKEGQNARLAARLTGAKIDIRIDE